MRLLAHLLLSAAALPAGDPSGAARGHLPARRASSAPRGGAIRATPSLPPPTRTPIRDAGAVVAAGGARPEAARPSAARPPIGARPLPRVAARRGAGGQTARGRRRRARHLRAADVRPPGRAAMRGSARAGSRTSATRGSRARSATRPDDAGAEPACRADRDRARRRGRLHLRRDRRAGHGQVPGGVAGEGARRPARVRPGAVRRRHGPGDGIVLRTSGNFYGHRGPGPLFVRSRRCTRATRPALDGVGVRVRGSAEHPVEVPTGLPAAWCARGTRSTTWSRWRSCARATCCSSSTRPGKSSPFLPSKLVDYLGAQAPDRGADAARGGGPAGRARGRLGRRPGRRGGVSGRDGRSARGLRQGRAPGPRRTSWPSTRRAR